VVGSWRTTHRFGSPQRRTPWLNREVLSCRWRLRRHLIQGIGCRLDLQKPLLNRAMVGATGFEPVTLPCQQTTGNRCANGRFRRSRRAGRLSGHGDPPLYLLPLEAAAGAPWSGDPAARERRVPRMANATSPLVEQRVVAFALGHPGFGPARIAAELARPHWGGIVLSTNGVWRVLRRHGLSTHAKRYGLVAGYAAPPEPQRPAPPPERHLNVEHPGQLVQLERVMSDNASEFRCPLPDPQADRPPPRSRALPSLLQHRAGTRADGPRAALPKPSSGRPSYGRRNADASPQLGDRKHN
jgi:hypothetical protein